MGLDLHTARPSARSGLLPTHTSEPERRADQAWGRRTAAHQNGMGAAPPLTPPGDHCPLGEGREGVQVRKGPRGSSPRAAPHHPPPGRPRDPDQTGTQGGRAPGTRGGPG